MTDLSLQQRFAQPGCITLGIDTKSSDIQADAEANTPDKNGSKRRGERYQLQRIAQKLMPENRVAKCSRWASKYRGADPSIDVRLDRTTGKASFGNLSMCGSVWHCPVCAAYITERRREELQRAVTEWAKRGGRIALMTLTFPHGINEPAQELIDKLARARARFFAERAFKEAMLDLGALGRVFALEITAGANGWHPHLHLLIFYRAKEDVALNRMECLRNYWAKCVRRAGLGETNEHGFDVRGGDFAAEYVAKFGKEPKSYLVWSAAHELTKSHIKRGKLSSLTPFDLLRLVEAQTSVSIGDRTITPEIAAGMFIEYAEAFHGRRQLTWSRGMREALGLDAEKTDAELAKEAETTKPPKVEILATLSNEDWKLILSRNARGAVIYVAEQYRSGAHIRALIGKLRESPPNDEHWHGIVHWRSWL